MGIKAVSTDKAPSAIGPYSQAISAGGFLFTSGQIAIDPLTSRMVPGGIEAQTRRVLDNLREILGSMGLTFQNVIKTTLFIKDMGDFPLINKIYAEYFSGPFPARSTVEAAKLPKDALIEIELIAEAVKPK